jgi:tRNA(Leu) C34 or U34 (ribose-2'-O)-methylase TrmL
MTAADFEFWYVQHGEDVDHLALVAVAGHSFQHEVRTLRRCVCDEINNLSFNTHRRWHDLFAGFTGHRRVIIASSRPLLPGLQFRLHPLLQTFYMYVSHRT